ncbi:MAG: YihY/virulence factor BrkB family protein [Chloroflexi bacterium]|nr:MAG: YihY/virulence factor BrkB family protein [Chloroflexota bacterium]
MLAGTFEQPRDGWIAPLKRLGAAKTWHNGCYTMQRWVFHRCIGLSLELPMKKWLDLFKNTFSEFSDDNCARLGASLSYYTLSSLIPLLLVIASVLSIFLTSTETGQQYQQQVIDYVAGAIRSEQFAEQLTESLTGAQESQSSGGVIGTVVGFLTLLLAASGVFGELDAAFNIIWDVPKDRQPSGVWAFIKSKFFSFTLVLGVVFLLLVSTLLTSTLNIILNALSLGPAWLFSVINFFVTLGIISFVFSVLFKYLPDVDVQWRDVLTGGVITAVLWTIGQYLMSFYFSFSSSFSSYGIIGSVLAFLVYVYYSSQILFLGGEFTQVYARSHGSMAAENNPGATGITPEAALMVQAAASGSRRRQQQVVSSKDQELAAAKTKQYAAATTGGIIGLLAGAAIGGAGLIVGLARGVGKLRRG